MLDLRVSEQRGTQAQAEADAAGAGGGGAEAERANNFEQQCSIRPRRPAARVLWPT